MKRRENYPAGASYQRHTVCGALPPMGFQSDHGNAMGRGHRHGEFFLKSANVFSLFEYVKQKFLK